MRGGAGKERVRQSVNWVHIHVFTVCSPWVSWASVFSRAHLCFGRHICIYTNVKFIIMSIICLRLPATSCSLCPWLSSAFISAAVSSFRQLFTQSARKPALNTAIRWHTESRNRHNQSSTDVISNFIIPSLSFSLTLSSSPFVSRSICSPPHDHNSSTSMEIYKEGEWIAVCHSTDGKIDSF